MSSDDIAIGAGARHEECVDVNLPEARGEVASGREYALVVKVIVNILDREKALGQVGEVG